MAGGEVEQRELNLDFLKEINLRQDTAMATITVLRAQKPRAYAFQKPRYFGSMKGLKEQEVLRHV